MIIAGSILGVATIAGGWALLAAFLSLVKRGRTDNALDYGFPGEGFRGFPHNLGK